MSRGKIEVHALDVSDKGSIPADFANVSANGPSIF